MGGTEDGQEGVVKEGGKDRNEGTHPGRKSAPLGQLATCLSQEGRWECYCKYMEKNCSTFFLTMQCTYRGHLAVLALSDYQEFKAAR